MGKTSVSDCTPFMRQRNCSELSSKGGGTRSQDLCLLSWEILQICRAWQTCLLVRHIPSHQNVIADSAPSLSPRSGRSTPIISRRSSPHTVNRPFCDLSQCTTPGLSISLPRHECEGDRCAIPHVGFSGGVVRLSPYPAANSGHKED